MPDRTSADTPPMECLGCGYTLDDDSAKFCPTCGRSLDPNETSTVKDRDRAVTPPIAAPRKKCLGCGYILDGLPENRCPECGQLFSPDNPDTFTGGDPGRRPVHSGTNLLIIACVGALLLFGGVVYFACGGGVGGGVAFHPWAAPTPSGDILVGLCGMPLGVVLELVVLVGFLQTRSRERPARSRDVAGWIALLSICLVILMLFSKAME